ncbi:putative flavonol 3-O-glucosyltransferase [Helianthus annuus]|nr:putative flavonol 3-O-glucosyltransferase [Helianthus annuus]
MANEVAEVIFIPSPGVGHIKSTIELAKLLVNRDQRLAITVLVIKPPGATSGLAITTYIESLAENAIDRISFVQLPQDETPPIVDPKDQRNFKIEFINSHCKYVRNAVADLKSQPGSGRVVGFVVDMFCASMIDVANEFNVPTFVFFTSNAAFLGFTLYIKSLCDDLNNDVDVVELSNSDTEILVSSFVKPVPTKVFWSRVKTRAGLDFVRWFAQKLGEAKAIMVNTFLELETHAIESLSVDTSIPPVYPVGPIVNLEGGSGGGKSFDNDVIRWLDSQPPSSVVFLCFGSMGSFDEVQVKEIARGLELSGYRFVWSLRRPPSDQTSRSPSDYEDPSVVLPEGFLERTHGIGKVIGWAPQAEVLGHDAVGGFVSHCGWNSLLESLWFGVPTAAWPMYAEQQMNAFEMVVELGLAVEIKLDYMKDLFNPKANAIIVTAVEIESGIRRLMEDNEIRRKVKEMSAKSRSAMVKGGSSYASVGSLIQDLTRDIS